MVDSRVPSSDWLMAAGDQLQPEGEFPRRPDPVWSPGERAALVRREDTLHTHPATAMGTAMMRTRRPCCV